MSTIKPLEERHHCASTKHIKGEMGNRYHTEKELQSSNFIVQGSLMAACLMILLVLSRDVMQSCPPSLWARVT